MPADAGYAQNFPVEANASEVDQRKAALLRERLVAISGRLEAEARRRVGLRQSIEERWLRDLEQYHGVYDALTQKRISKKTAKSKLFVNQTRPKTNAMAARIMDLLFPTDDRNWGIQPTPVPSLSAEAKAAARRASRAAAEVEALEADTPDDQQDTSAELGAARAVAVDAMKIAAALRDQMAEARRRSDLMTEEIDDQLKECDYQARMRDVVEDACRIGTGIAKGPLAGEARQAWSQIEDGVFELQVESDPAPAYYRVDPWHFFPDPDARTMADSESAFERHLLKRKGLQRLAKQPGFDPDAIRRLLGEEPRDAAPQFISDLRSITSTTAQSAGGYYTVWEYHGPLTAEELMTIAVTLGDIDMVPEEIDPLTEISAIIWFCQGEILKFGIYPMDSGECLYSVFCLEKDEASIFGFGVPYIIRDPQAALNGGWRMMLDNAGLSVGPQIVVSMEHIEPEDGNWALTPMKVWKRKANAPAGVPVFEVHNLTSNQEELANIIGLSKQFIDDVSALPMLAQGEQGQQTTQTMGGMSILMNSANVVFRRIVKNFDDDVTVPNIRRLYHWNMQHSPRQEIKGDMQVDARGSSVLLVRELQAQNLMAIAMQFGGHPVYGSMLKHPELLREIFKAHLLAADKMVLSDQEIAEAQQAAQADPEQDPRVVAARVQQDTAIQVANQNRDMRIAVARITYDANMMKLAEERNMSLDEIEARLQEFREKRESDERMVAAEIAMTEEFGPTGGGNF